MTDLRFRAVKLMLEKGDFDTFAQVFTVIPISVLAKEMRWNYGRLADKIRNPDTFTKDDIDKISKVFDVKVSIIIRLLRKN